MARQQQQQGRQQQQPQQSPKREEVQKPVVASYTKNVPYQRASIGNRLSDFFFITTYVTWTLLAFVLFFARCEQLLPEKLNDMEFSLPVCNALKTFEGPLRPFLESQQHWGDKMFPTNAEFAIKLVNVVNLCFLAPASALLAFGFFFGFRWVKNVALLHAAAMLYTMLIVFQIYGTEAADRIYANVEAAYTQHLANVFEGFVVYGFFTVFPLVVIQRVWGNCPFSLESVSKKRGAVMRFVVFTFRFALYLWMLSAVLVFYEFSVKHSASLKHMPSVVDTSIDGWEKAAPYREQILVKAIEFQAIAGEKILEGASASKEMLKDLGNNVLEWAQSFQVPEEPEKQKGAAKRKEASPSKKQTTQVPKRHAKPPPPKKQAPPVDVVEQVIPGVQDQKRDEL